MKQSENSNFAQDYSGIVQIPTLCSTYTFIYKKKLLMISQDRVAIARRLREEGDDVEGKLSSSLKKVLGEIEMKVGVM